jgi:putative transcriptional regulator
LNENIQLRNRLKVARAEKSLSQEQLALLAGVTRQTISSIETGQYCPTAKLALILSKVLNKKFEDLFFLEEEKKHEYKNQQTRNRECETYQSCKN